MLAFFTNLSLLEFQVRYLVLLRLFSVTDGFELFWMGSLHKNIQLCWSSSRLHSWSINELPDDVICNIVTYADDTTLYSKCDQASDLWQLELASELASDLQDTLNWGRKWLVDFDSAAIQLVYFDWSNNTDATDVKMDGSVLGGKSSFKMLGLTFYSKLDWGSYIISIAKTASKKIGAFIRFMKSLPPEVALYLYKSTIRPRMEYCCHVWDGATGCYLESLDKLQKRI